MATSGEHDGEHDRPVEDMSYTEASAELDSIVGFFEGREVDVDQLVDQLVRATAIIEELDRRLRRTQMQVEQLVPRLTAVLDDAADDSAPGYEDPGMVGEDQLVGDGESGRGMPGPSEPAWLGDRDDARGRAAGGDDARGDRSPGLF